MLTKIKYQLSGIVVNSNDTELIKNELKNVISDIDAFQEANKPLSDMHSTFRTLEEYSSLYEVETAKFSAIPNEKYLDRAWKIQEILSVLSLILSLINDVLRKYNNPSSADGSQAAKYLRMLNTNQEHFKSERMSWIVALKAQTAVIEDFTLQRQLRAKRVDK